MAPSDTRDELVFFVNGKKVVEKDVDPETTLLTYLRRKRIQCQKTQQKALNAYSLS